MNIEKLRHNIDSIRNRISGAAHSAGRNPGDITLVAVTKTTDAPVIKALVELGIKHLGENRVQDAGRKKKALLDLDVKWHMIGHLQRNKINGAYEIFDYFHSIDSLRLALEMNNKAQSSGRIIPALLEINISGEQSKHGFIPDEIKQKIEEIVELPGLKIEGLMTMAPFTSDKEVCRHCFRGLRLLAKDIEQKINMTLPHLSMGMSGDFEVAIEEGATMVRIGSAFFHGI